MKIIVLVWSWRSLCAIVGKSCEIEPIGCYRSLIGNRIRPSRWYENHRLWMHLKSQLTTSTVGNPSDIWASCVTWVLYLVPFLRYMYSNLLLENRKFSAPLLISCPRPRWSLSNLSKSLTDLKTRAVWGANSEDFVIYSSFACTILRVQQSVTDGQTERRTHGLVDDR